MIPVRTCLPLFCWTKKLMKTEESSSILPFFWDLLLGPICSMWAWASQTLTLFRECARNTSINLIDLADLLMFVEQVSR